MKTETTERGFRCLMHPEYLTPNEELRLAQESSAIGNYEDAMGKPGSSYLWIGSKFHLDREQVAELVEYLNGWLDTGRLPESIPPSPFKFGVGDEVSVVGDGWSDDGIVLAAFLKAGGNRVVYAVSMPDGDPMLFEENRVWPRKG